MPGTKLFKFCTALYIMNSYFYTICWWNIYWWR